MVFYILRYQIKPYTVSTSEFKVIGIRMTRRLRVTSLERIFLSGAEMLIQCKQYHRNPNKTTNPSTPYGSIPIQWTRSFRVCRLAAAWG